MNKPIFTLKAPLDDSLRPLAKAKPELARAAPRNIHEGNVRRLREMIGVRVPNARLSHDLRNTGRMIVIGGQTKCDPYPLSGLIAHRPSCYKGKDQLRVQIL